MYRAENFRIVVCVYRDQCLIFSFCQFHDRFNLLSTLEYITQPIEWGLEKPEQLIREA